MPVRMLRRSLTTWGRVRHKASAIRIDHCALKYRAQLQTLNNVQLLDGEWLRFVEGYLDKPSDNSLDKTRKIHDDYIHDFVFDDGHIQNIYLLDKKILPTIRYR